MEQAQELDATIRLSAPACRVRDADRCAAQAGQNLEVLGYGE